ncbi:hypothetical protein L1987_86930 [Smallanthus sonchifolius]|uniref:Uncharacterized protein n=1 Tax=Smallanthus sonchifolius TaxID=185202 RepID=A0ACB8Y1X5_9ASTR|nr:hypothetical protein L1987_86930 [Smallanthus sonchifolius]
MLAAAPHSPVGSMVFFLYKTKQGFRFTKLIIPPPTSFRLAHTSIFPASQRAGVVWRNHSSNSLEAKKLQILFREKSSNFKNGLHDILFIVGLNIDGHAATGVETDENIIEVLKNFVHESVVNHLKAASKGTLALSSLNTLKKDELTSEESLKLFYFLASIKRGLPPLRRMKDRHWSKPEGVRRWNDEFSKAKALCDDRTKFIVEYHVSTSAMDETSPTQSLGMDERSSTQSSPTHRPTRTSNELPTTSRHKQSKERRVNLFSPGPSTITRDGRSLIKELIKNEKPRNLYFPVMKLVGYVL